MACARCSSCDVNLPSDKRICPACGEPTWLCKAEGDTHDSDWQAQIARRRAILEGGATPDIDEDLISFKGRTWLAEKILQDWGYDPRDLDIVQVRGQFYELAGRLNGDTNGWWLEPIEVPELADEDVHAWVS